jgi:hypothetical protein
VATFLELVQETVRDSGTAGVAVPGSVDVSTGRLASFVRWVRNAYRAIQTERRDWAWLRQEVTATALPGVDSYDASAFGETRFAEWILGPYNAESGFTIYNTATGRADEGHLVFVEWDRFKALYRFGANATQTGRPAFVSVDPHQNVVLWPLPDDTYTLRGEVMRTPQELEADADVPEMPARHHDAIKYKALLLMATYDEAFEQEARWDLEYRRHMTGLVSSQTPRIMLAGAWA